MDGHWVARRRPGLDCEGGADEVRQEWCVGSRQREVKESRGRAGATVSLGRVVAGIAGGRHSYVISACLSRLKRQAGIRPAKIVVRRDLSASVIKYAQVT